MSINQDMALVGAADRARLAQTAARGAAALDSRPSQIRLGVIIEQTGGSYTVGLVSAAGSVGDTIPGVRGWGDASFADGDRVFLVYVGDRPIPYILSSAGSGSGGDSGFLFTVSIFGG